MAVGFPTKVNYATGDVLTATNMNDLSGTVNLLESAAESAAGVNKIINGDFGIWQRGTSITATSGQYTYGPDRFSVYGYGVGTGTVTQQTFTAGTAPVAGYEGTYFARFKSTNTNLRVQQPIEDVRTFAGQTVAVSFWMKSPTGTTADVFYAQNFGSGGSAGVDIGGSTITISSSWARYTATVAIPSVAGKTIGTSSYLAIRFGAAINLDIDIWGVQMEVGSTASDFKTATGTKQGELAACQRYYYRQNGISNTPFGFGMAASTTSFRLSLPYKQPMRVSPSSIDFSGLQVVDTVGGYAVSNLVITAAGTDFADLTATSTGMTAQRAGWINGSGTCFIGLSAEL
jgi:hypothetical protein